MKNGIFISLAILVFGIGCTKVQSPGYDQIMTPSIAKAYAYMKGVLPANEFQLINWKHAINGTIGKDGFVVVAPVSDSEKNNIVISYSDSKWVCNYYRTQLTYGLDKKATGSIITKSLDKTNTRSYEFQNGKYSGPNSSADRAINSTTKKVKVNVYNAENLPPVTVSAIIPPNNDFSFLNSLYWITGQNPSFFNIFIDDTYSNSSYTIYNNIAYLIDNDDSELRDIVDLVKFIQCFGNISNSGATYTATLCADIPANDHPGILFNIFSGHPGHAFITLTKSNGGETITQSFGFYPRYGLSSMGFDQVESAIKDDGGHEYNASITMTGLSESSFSAIFATAIQRSLLTYDLNDNNCVDFAVAAFNAARPSNPIFFPPSGFGFGMTPNGLYNQLNYMKSTDPSLSSSIFKGKDNAPVSHGECH